MMKPAQLNIIKSLIALAWADGQMSSSEAAVVEGLLIDFDATESEELALLEWARTPRSLSKDVPVSEMSDEDRALLLSNGALLIQADGLETSGEKSALAQLTHLLGYSPQEAAKIITGSRGYS
ncbi:MAG: TerB family tellurite resistance protein [Polyangiaceae bacterium]|nr:TerB family tellurite resistance protein [Polyangiaceae bacterium]